MSSVLLAEDEFLIRAVLVDALSDVGVDCIEAATGRDALDVLESDAPLGVVIVDIGLPDMSGEKVIEAAAASTSASAKMVVLLNMIRFLYG